ncbi:MAG TPA: hypothetical protein VG096_11965 [Bryobacteraceae bacterium]|jgi:hypothetical protein|nr:hypothetical protein [Bryobacteraceae bacterium]
MKKILLFAIGVAGLAIASTNSYSVKLLSPAMLGTIALEPGEYRVEVIDQKAVIRNGRFHGEAPVKVESGDTKYGTTVVRFNTADGKMHIQEIHVGGTKTKLVFEE